MDKRTRITKSIFVLFLGFISVKQVLAFELLTEGAMGSVSAISAESADDIINVAGDSAAGIVDDDYEQLPFESDVSTEIRQSIVLDEVSVELDFALTQEVEAWADELQKNAGVEINVGIVDELPGGGDAVLFVPEGEVQDGVIGFSVVDEDDAVFQARRVDDSVIQSERGDISYTVERYIERVELVNRTVVDGPVLGDGYVTDLRGVSNITLTAIRE